MAVFPEDMNRTDADNPSEALRVIDRYIRYMGERIEFAFSQMTRTVSAAGVSSVEMYILLSSLQTEVAKINSAISILTGDVTALSGSLSTLHNEFNTLQGTVGDMNESLTSISAGLSSVQTGLINTNGAVAALEARVTQLEQAEEQTGGE